MIIKKNINFTESHKNLKGGLGITNIINILDKENLCQEGEFLNIMELDVGDSIGAHSHIGELEIYYILEGTGEILDNGNFYAVTSGDCAVAYENEIHSIKNTGSEKLKWIALILYKNHGS